MAKAVRHIMVYFMMMVSFVYCSQKEVPPLSLADDKIIDVLIDVHLAEATMQSLGKQVKDSIKQVYYDQIAQIHNIERAELDSLLSQLRNQPPHLKRLYQEMMERIEVMEKEYEAKKDQEKKGIDTTDIIQVKEKKLEN